MRNRMKVLSLFSLAGLVSAGLAVFVMYGRCKDQLRHDFASGMLTMTRSLAALMDGDYLSQVHSQDEEQSVQYQAARSLLQRLVKAGRSKDSDWYVKDLCTFSASPTNADVPVYGVDAERDPKLVARAGESYLQNDPRRPVKIGSDSVLTEPTDYSDGSYIVSSFAPILSKAGKPVAELEVDLDAVRLSAIDKPALWAGAFPSILTGFLGLAIGLVGVGAWRLGDRWDRLERYLPEPVRKTPSRIFKPALKQVTVLFADLRDFTKTAETMRPEHVVGVLANIFEQMSQIVSSHNGFIDKFLGDGFMAIFGATDETHDAYQHMDAVAAAVELQQKLKVLSADWEHKDRPALHMGIGINSGSVILGSIGSASRREYTAIGSAVNIASRLQSETKELGVQILISEGVHSEVKPSFTCERKGPIQLRGESQERIVYAVETAPAA